MSMDAGGLAQMAYNPSFNSALGVPGSGFASRGKGSHIKRLSMPPPPKISTIDETQAANVASTPRTSRSHLLAGLRTAPKSAVLPSTAPMSHGQFNLGDNKYADPLQAFASRGPQTATATTFGSQVHNLGMNNGRQMYSLPEQVLAPPTIEVGGVAGEDQMDSKLYQELMATNMYLAQQQQRLQQQLINVTAAAQQFQGMSMNNGYGVTVQQQMQGQTSSNMHFYNQQVQQGMQPVITPIPGTPGVYQVYNPMTGQSSFVVDNTMTQQQDSPPPAYQEMASSQPLSTPSFRAQVSPPPAEAFASPADTVRGRSPAKSTSPPAQAHEPLPPPSANAFRRGHKKSLSFATGIRTGSEGTNNAAPKSAGYPQTPLTGTFGPGQARAGEHPVRQPRGPPSLEDLVAKPTSKYEGSKNFVTRQRRRAVHNLVRAGLERRGESRTGSGSAGSVTPASENEFHFSVSSSDNDDVSGGGGLSSKPSLGSLRAVANGAIGSERKESKSRERGSVDSVEYSATSLSSDEGLGGKPVDVDTKPSAERRKTPMLVLSSAEKRKSFIL